MASLLHVPESELLDVLRNYRDALVPGGVFFASFKHGVGAAVSGDRLFTRQCHETFDRVIQDVPGLHLIEDSIDRDTRPGRTEDEWFSVLCRRK